MANKNKAIPGGTVQFNKLIAELPEKRDNIKAHMQFRHDFLESQKELITRANSIVFKVLKNCQDWMPTQNQECKNYRRKQGNH